MLERPGASGNACFPKPRWRVAPRLAKLISSTVVLKAYRMRIYVAALAIGRPGVTRKVEKTLASGFSYVRT
jgi:hypothetical protein